MGNANSSEWGNRYNGTWQMNMLMALGEIITNTATSGGPDYELVTTYYKANKNGVGYTLGDSITRTQIY